MLACVQAAAATLLGGERVALNLLQRLSGVATLTRPAVEAVPGTGARITHTRKTTRGLRALERYAVTVAGGATNRASLAAAVLWKDAITLETVRPYAKAGAQVISIGALTHSAPAAPGATSRRPRAQDPAREGRTERAVHSSPTAVGGR